MPQFILSMLAVIRVFFRSRTDTALELLAPRQQVAVLKRKRRRPTLKSLDRFFWTTLDCLWSRWSEVLVIVKHKTFSAGTVPDSACSGVGVPARPASDQSFSGRFDSSFDDGGGVRSFGPALHAPKGVGAL